MSRCNGALGDYPQPKSYETSKGDVPEAVRGMNWTEYDSARHTWKQQEAKGLGQILPSQMF